MAHWHSSSSSSSSFSSFSSSFYKAGSFLSCPHYFLQGELLLLTTKTLSQENLPKGKDECEREERWDMFASRHRWRLLLDHALPPFHALVEAVSPKAADRLYRPHILHPLTLQPPRPVDGRLPVVVVDRVPPLLLHLALGHLEDHLHVVRWATPSNSSMQVSSGNDQVRCMKAILNVSPAWGWDEIVVLARPELQATWCWTETPEKKSCNWICMLIIRTHDPSLNLNGKRLSLGLQSNPLAAAPPSVSGFPTSLK